MRAALVLALLVPFAAGCLEDDEDLSHTGKSVLYEWRTSRRSCTDGVCTYGTNHESSTQTLRCDSQPTLSWSSGSWHHGSMTATVLDDDGKEAATHTISSAHTEGEDVVAGKTGLWTFKVTTNNANGGGRLTLTC